VAKESDSGERNAVFFIWTFIPPVFKPRRQEFEGSHTKRVPAKKIEDYIALAEEVTKLLLPLINRDNS
jgi:hypothetical protein